MKTNNAEALRALLEAWPYINCVCGRSHKRLPDEAREELKAALAATPVPAVEREAVAWALAKLDDWIEHYTAVVQREQFTDQDGRDYLSDLVCGLRLMRKKLRTTPPAEAREPEPRGAVDAVNPNVFGIACTVAWTELVQALRADGHDVKDKSGPSTRKWMEGIVRDTFAATRPSAAPAAETGADAKDAARYRWLRQQDVRFNLSPKFRDHWLDKAVDAALNPTQDAAHGGRG